MWPRRRGCSGTTASATTCAGSCAASRVWCAAIRQRVQGSPDLFGADGAARSLNFITAHDGLTLHDLTVVTGDRHRSWDCGPELRLQQLKNYFADAAAVGGHPDVGDGRRVRSHPAGSRQPVRHRRTAHLGRLVASAMSGASSPSSSATCRRCGGAHPPSRPPLLRRGAEVDDSHESRSIAWCASDLYVMVNAWWEPLTFEVQEPGEWAVVLATAEPDGLTLAPRSVVVLERTA